MPLKHKDQGLAAFHTGDPAFQFDNSFSTAAQTTEAKPTGAVDSPQCSVAIADPTAGLFWVKRTRLNGKKNCTRCQKERRFNIVASQWRCFQKMYIWNTSELHSIITIRGHTIFCRPLARLCPFNLTFVLSIWFTTNKDSHKVRTPKRPGISEPPWQVCERLPTILHDPQIDDLRGMPTNFVIS